MNFRPLKPSATTFFLFILSFCLGHPANAGACKDCLPNWDHTKEVIIDNTANGTELHGHQVNLKVNTQNLITAGDLQNDGADLRFMTDDCDPLCHSVDEGMNSSNTDIWVKVDTIAAGSKDTIYMYYGNSAAGDVADSTCVFDFYEGFEDGNTNNWTSNCVKSSSQTCGGNVNTGGCGDSCDPTTATTAEANSGSNSAKMFSHASCFCSPYNGPTNEFQRSISIPNGDYVLDFAHKEWQNMHGYCSCSGCAAADINACMDGTNVYNSASNCTYDNCNQCQDPWTEGTSSCFTVTGGSTQLTFWENPGDCKENETFLDDIRLRKCPSPPASVGTVVTPMAITVNATDPTCNNSDGSINVSVSGGTSPYQFSNDGGATFQGSNSFSGLSAGSYQVVAKDDAGCSLDSTVTLNGNPVPSDISFNVTTATCGSSDGSVDITGVTGGTAPYQYDFDGSGFSNTTTYNGLATGSYPVTVQDANGCTYQEAVNVPNSGAPTIDNLKVTDNTCNGSCDGSLDVQASGGKAPYQYSNDGGASFQGSNVFNGLCAGTYNVVVEDDNGCKDSVQGMIGQPSAVQVFPPDDTTICIGGIATLTANASGGTPAYTYHWDQGLGTGKSQTVSPGSNTVYMVYAEDANGCSSGPKTVRVELYPPLQVSTSPDAAICPGETAQLTATASGGSGSGYSYSWSNGASGSSVIVSPGSSKEYIVTLEDGCETPAVKDTVKVTVDPLPNVKIAGQDLEGCRPVEATLVNATSPSMVGGDCHWDLGNGVRIASCDTITPRFDAPGCHDVKLTVESPDGCVDSTTRSNYVCVRPYPKADFTSDPKETTVQDPEVRFTNLSTGASSYRWNIGGLDTSRELHPVHSFPAGEAGTYKVCLRTENSYGCRDSICKEVMVRGKFVLYVPNAFTPDGDGVNDKFGPVIQGADETDYRFMIYDQWGQKVFQTKDPEKKWDGSIDGDQGSSRTDVYVWRIVTKNEYTGKSVEKKGHVTLVR